MAAGALPPFSQTWISVNEVCDYLFMTMTHRAKCLGGDAVNITVYYDYIIDMLF